MPTYLSPGVYVQEVDSGSRPIEGVGTAVAAFVGLAERGPFDQPTLISNWNQYTATFGEPVSGTYLGLSVYGYFMNGGGNCYVVRIGEDGAETNGGPPRGKGRRTQAAAAPAPEAVVGGYRVVAHGGAGDVTVEVAPAGGEEPADDMFKLVVKQGGEVKEEFDRLVTGRGRTNAATVVNGASKLIRIEETAPGTAGQKPPIGAVATPGDPRPAAAVPGPRLSAEDYIGDVAERSGVEGLQAVDNVTMVAVPDLMSAYQQGALDLEQVQAVQQGLIAHCELMGNRVAILDPPPGHNAQQIEEWRVHKAGYDSKFATLYWPWVRVADPADGNVVHAPPSGFVAGIWGRNDDTRGVHKAPANEVVRGAVSLEIQITKNEHDILNPVGVNCLRAFPGRGIRVWGARTLSSDPAWRYLNIRRLFNYLEESILTGTQWVVFEPNNRSLWAKVRRTLNAFLVNEWRRGALFGATPDEAFYVICDDSTNSQESIDAGQLICEIGVAPVKPAEFVIFRLTQFSGGTALVSE